MNKLIKRSMVALLKLMEVKLKSSGISILVYASLLFAISGCKVSLFEKIFSKSPKWSGTITQCPEKYFDQVDGVHVRLLSGEDRDKVVVFPVVQLEKGSSFAFTIKSSDVKEKFGLETLTDADSLEITFHRRFNAKLTVQSSGAQSSDTTVVIDAAVLDSINCFAIQEKYSELLGSALLGYVRSWEQLSASGLAVSAKISTSNILLQLVYEPIEFKTDCVVPPCIPTIDPDSAI